MTTVQSGVAKLPLRAAMEARNLPAIVNAFAPDAVFHSPLTEKLAFQGRDQIAIISEVILGVFENLHYTQELWAGDTAFLVAEARIGGQDIEIVDHIRLNQGGQITEFTPFFRPLPAAAMALRVIGSELGRRRSRLRGAFISYLAAPLALMTRRGDNVGVRLLRSTLER